MTTTTMGKDNGTVLPAPALSPTSVEGGWGKKEEGGNDGQGEGGGVIRHQGQAHVRLPWRRCCHDLGARPSPLDNEVVMTDGGVGGKEGNVELRLAIFVRWEDARQFSDCSNGDDSSRRVAMEYSAFNAIKDAKRYLMGEGGAGADNNQGRGAAINARGNGTIQLPRAIFYFICTWAWARLI
jgi:hypothetical protein